MNDLYLVIDNFDADVKICRGLEAVETFLKTVFYQNPALYQVMTTDADEPYLSELNIPKGWEYVEETEEGQTT